MGVNDYFKDFKGGLKINNDLDNLREGSHWDIMTDLRREIRGIEKIRITSEGDVLGGETKIGPNKLKW